MKIKEWWNDFEQDLIFNITMVIMTTILFGMMICLSVIAFKDLLGVMLS